LFGEAAVDVHRLKIPKFRGYNPDYLSTESPPRIIILKSYRKPPGDSYSSWRQFYLYWSKTVVRGSKEKEAASE
jgi:hypothetical protein